MRLDTHLSQRMDQKMILAPRMIQSMEILQLPIMALQERIQQELQENPVLELKEVSADDQPAEEEAAAPAAEGEEAAAEDGDELADFDLDRLEALSRDWDYNEEHRLSRNGVDEEGDKKHDAMQNMASRPQTLQDYLNDQAAFLEATPEQLRLVRFLITHVGDDGRL